MPQNTTIDRASSRTPPTQPLAAADHPDALLKMATVVAMTGMSPSTIYRLIAAGELVPIRRGTRCTRFLAADVTTWLQAQAATRGATQ